MTETSHGPADLNKFVEAASKLAENKPLRRGQLYFNKLFEIKPNLANNIRGTEFDPFYDDSRITVFLLYCQEHWNDSETGLGQ